MSPLVPGVGGALIVAGILVLIAGLRPAPARTVRPRTSRTLTERIRRLPRRTLALVAAGVAVGFVVWLVTGWVIAVVALPAALVGFPVLLAASPETARIARLEAMAEWTRNLAGVLTAGVGLEQALAATLRSTPTAIRPEVEQLVGRLRARWASEDALRAFADDLDDTTGDLIAAYLVLGARRRGPGLAAVLTGLAESVAEEVASRRQIEADRAKPRGTLRLVSALTAGGLVVFALTGVLAPYGSPIGQAALSVLLTVYAGCLVWMNRMSAAKPAVRFIGSRTEGTTT